MKMNKKALTVTITMSLLMGMNSVAMARASCYVHGVDGDAGTVSVRDANYDNIEITTTSGTVASGYFQANWTGYLSNHSFTINKGTWGYVYGGYFGGYAVSSTTDILVDSNIVTLQKDATGTGVTVQNSVYGGYVITGSSFSYAAKANSNQVAMTGGSVKNENIYGGYVYHEGAAGDAEASGNTVTLNEVTAFNVYGGNAQNRNNGGTTDKNTVTINGGSVSNLIYGGNAVAGSGDAEASNNTVTLGSNVTLGSDVHGSPVVYGGWATSYDSTATATASNNKVNLGGSYDSATKLVTLSAAEEWSNANLAKAILFGGYVADNGCNLKCGGNELNVFLPTTVKGIGMASNGGDLANKNSFQNMNFYIPATATSGATMLTVTNAVDGNGTTLNTYTSYTAADNNTVNYDGRTIILLKSDAGLSNFTQFQIDGGTASDSTVEKAIAVTKTGITNLQAVVCYNVASDNKSISFGTKAYQLNGEAAVSDDVALTTTLYNTAGENATLNLNNQTINMQQASTATGDEVKYSTLTVGTLSGSGKLKIDADLAGNKNDKLQVTTGAESGTTLDLSSILVRSDSTGDSGSITYVTGNGAASSNLNYTINSDGSAGNSSVKDTSVVVGTSDYTYTFKLSNSKGQADYTRTLNMTLADFVTGTNKGATATSYTLTKNTTFADANALTTNRTGTASKNLTLGINQDVTLSGLYDSTDTSKKAGGIIVADGYTLNVDGATTGGTNNGIISSFTTALTNNAGGTLNVSNVAMTNNDTDIANSGTATLTNVQANKISNASTMKLAGTNTIGTVSDAGTTEITGGTTTVSSAFTQNGLTVDSGATYSQTGGSFTVNGNVTNNGTVNLTNVTAIDLKGTASINSVSGTVTDLKLTIPSGLSGAQLTVTDSALNVGTLDTDVTNYTGSDITLISDTNGITINSFKINGVEGKTKVVDANKTGITNLQSTIGYTTTDAKKLTFGALSGYSLKDDSEVTGAVSLDDTLDANSHAINVKDGGILSVKSLTNVGDVNFYIPKTAVNGATMVTVTDSEKVVDLSNSNVKAGVETGSALVAGNKINLIATTAGITAPKSATGNVIQKGYTDYNLDIAVEDKNLVATVSSKAGENAKSSLETMAAGLSMLNLGGDMLAGEGMDSAVQAARFGEASGDIFAAVGGNKSKIKTGSHVDLKGVTMNLGFVKEIANKSGSLFIGPVVEYGHGTYDSYLDNGYHGEGNSKYWGLGVLAKQLNNSGMYYEGSLRGGKVENDYSAAQGGYDADAKYIAAHLGVGKIVKLNDKNNIDVYAKYFLTHQSGSDVVNATNNFDFSCATSNRTRFGARYNHNFTEKNSIYGGLAWQYEFSGETKGTIDGNSVEAPSIKGHTGILELGWKANPTKNFDISIGMNGYTGVERGVGANLKLNWKF